MTKREMFANIANLLADNEEVVAFCNHEIELLGNRKSSKRGMTVAQKANLKVKVAIINVLEEADAPLTVTEMIADERLSTFTYQKISALLRQLIEANEVSKIIEGKKAKFSLVEKEEE